MCCSLPQWNGLSWVVATRGRSFFRDLQNIWFSYLPRSFCRLFSHVKDTSATYTRDRSTRRVGKHVVHRQGLFVNSTNGPAECTQEQFLELGRAAFSICWWWVVQITLIGSNTHQQCSRSLLIHRWPLDSPRAKPFGNFVHHGNIKLDRYLLDGGADIRTFSGRYTNPMAKAYSAGTRTSSTSCSREAPIRTRF